MSTDRLLLGGCGILRKEVQWLIARHGWPVDTLFLDSALHCDLERLGKGLAGTLERRRQSPVVVFYGACHPHMDQMLDAAGTLRTEGQNCVEMLLGHERFTQELVEGAYFLLEEWAHRWSAITYRTFGTNPAVIRGIFQGDRRYLLGLRTPCSSDFAREAEAAADLVGLPLRWLDVPLDHLDAVLSDAIARKRQALDATGLVP